MPPLPTFDRPPLTETILGMQFDLLPELRTAHLGAYMVELGSDWEQMLDAPALGQTHEPVSRDPDWMPGGLDLQLSGMLSAVTRPRPHGSFLLIALDQRAELPLLARVIHELSNPPEQRRQARPGAVSAEGS